MKAQDLPIGVEDFAEAKKKYYVDKTLLVRDLIERGEGKAILLTRPRRFGKSLSLSMVDYFFDQKKDSHDLFKGTKLMEEAPHLLSKMNGYPVVHLNMKGTEQTVFNTVLEAVKERIYSLLRGYPELLDSKALSEEEKVTLRQLCERKADGVALTHSLRTLTELLAKHYGKKVVLLIDEYDAPLQSAYDNGCYEDAIQFFRVFYGEALKGNPNLYLSLLTGVMQISKESLFSGLNNLLVASIDAPLFGSYFGFDEAETKRLLADFGIALPYDAVRDYYGGYYNAFGEELCNPWSMLNFAEERKLKPYWTNTGTNSLLLEIIEKEDSYGEVLDFLNNDAKRASFNPAISYKDIKQSANASLSFLAQAGYLSLWQEPGCYENSYVYKIPNKEIYDVFRVEIIGRSVREESMSIALSLKQAILSGQSGQVESLLKEYVLSSMSALDLADERNYHNAVTGILAVVFDRYVVQNEIYAGTGRCDIVMIPKKVGDIGVLIEIKKSKSKSQVSAKRLSALASQAIKQIKDKDYVEILRRHKCEKILLYGVAFWKKAAAVAGEIL